MHRRLGSNRTPNLHPISSIPQLLMGWKTHLDLLIHSWEPTTPGGHPESDPLWEVLPRGRLSLPTPTHKRTQASDRHRRRDILSLASFPSAAGRHARLARAQGLI